MTMEKKPIILRVEGKAENIAKKVALLYNKGKWREIPESSNAFFKIYLVYQLFEFQPSPIDGAVLRKLGMPEISDPYPKRRCLIIGTNEKPYTSYIFPEQFNVDKYHIKPDDMRNTLNAKLV